MHGQKRAPDALELELQAVASHLMWVLGGKQEPLEEYQELLTTKPSIRGSLLVLVVFSFASLWKPSLPPLNASHKAPFPPTVQHRDGISGTTRHSTETAFWVPYSTAQHSDNISGTPQHGTETASLLQLLRCPLSFYRSHRNDLGASFLPPVIFQFLLKQSHACLFST